MGVTIKDVARRTGLSVTTVSLVLNKKDSRISERTKQLVESAAQELNYTPNQTAVSLVTKRTQLVGLVLSETGYYYFADLARSAECACRNSGYHLLLSIVGQGDDEMNRRMEELIHRGVDGLIFDPSQLSGGAGERLTALGGPSLPIVPLGCVSSQLLPNSIAPSHRQGGYQAVQHLLAQGHRRVALLGGPSGQSAADELLEGYRDALEETGTPFLSSLVWEGPYTSEAGAKGLRAVLDQGITAVAAGSDAIACGVCRAARELGLSIPRDLSVTGYGASVLSEEMPVPLTTVSVHFDRIARKAVNLISRWDSSRPGIPPEVVTPTLLCRGSTAPPKPRP